LVLLAAQLKGWTTLREIETGFSSRENLIYHLGIKSLPKRSNLSKANYKRDYKVFESTFYDMLAYVRKNVSESKRLRFKKDLTIFDSTVITLSLKLFKWATFRRDGGFKIHVGYHLQRQAPVYAKVTHGNTLDISGLDTNLEKYTNGIIVFDKGYWSLLLFQKLIDLNVVFVTRLKRAINYEYVTRKLFPSGEVKSDSIVKFMGSKSGRKFHGTLRVIKFVDKETGKEFDFLTNEYKFSPRTIAYIYKKRWEIELFFKWLKQNLRIKKYLGTSENAVNVQVWVGLTAYLLLNYVQTKCQYKGGMLNFTRIVREMLFEDIGILEIMNDEMISLKVKSRNKDSDQLAF